MNSETRRDIYTVYKLKKAVQQVHNKQNESKTNPGRHLELFSRYNALTILGSRDLESRAVISHVTVQFAMCDFL